MAEEINDDGLENLTGTEKSAILMISHPISSAHSHN